MAQVAGYCSRSRRRKTAYFCSLPDMAKPQIPARDPRGREDAGPGPRIGCKPSVYIVRILRTEDEKNLAGPLERPGKAGRASGLQGIHEDAVALPIELCLQRLPGIVGRPI